MKMIDTLRERERERESSSLKNRKGITLIALVVSTKCSTNYVLK